MNIRMLAIFISIQMLPFLNIATVQADTLFLRGGEKLIGKILSEGPDQIIFGSQTLGEFAVAREYIEMIEIEGADAAFTNQIEIAEGLEPSLQEQFMPSLNGLEGATELDWIQLNTGEWLGGTLRSLQEERLTFESEKLDFQTFKWEDVRTLRSNGAASILLENNATEDGIVLVTPTEVRLYRTEGARTFPREQLLAITPTGDREIDKWSGQISAGFSSRSGQIRETSVDVQAKLFRLTPGTRFGLEYQGNFSRVDGLDTDNNHNILAQFDRQISRGYYARLLHMEYFRNPVQNLRFRLTVGAGLAYDLVDTAETDWRISAGPAWQRNEFVSVLPGDNISTDTLNFILGTNFQTELTERLDFLFQYRAQFTGQKAGGGQHNADASLEYEINNAFSLDLSAQWRRTSNTIVDSEGTKPAQDELRYITTLGVNF
jgi:hypothetical protein